MSSVKASNTTSDVYVKAAKLYEKSALEIHLSGSDPKVKEANRRAAYSYYRATTTIMVNGANKIASIMKNFSSSNMDISESQYKMGQVNSPKVQKKKMAYYNRAILLFDKSGNKDRAERA